VREVAAPAPTGEHPSPPQSPESAPDLGPEGEPEPEALPEPGPCVSEPQAEEEEEEEEEEEDRPDEEVEELKNRPILRQDAARQAELLSHLKRATGRGARVGVVGLVRKRRTEGHVDDRPTSLGPQVHLLTLECEFRSLNLAFGLPGVFGFGRTVGVGRSSSARVPRPARGRGRHRFVMFRRLAAARAPEVLLEHLAPTLWRRKEARMRSSSAGKPRLVDPDAIPPCVRQQQRAPSVV
jgi:hypothetical protein